MREIPGPFPIEVVAYAYSVRPGRAWHIAADMLTARFPSIDREAAVALISHLAEMTHTQRLGLEAVLNPHPLITYCTEE